MPHTGGEEVSDNGLTRRDLTRRLNDLNTNITNLDSLVTELTPIDQGRVVLQLQAMV